MPFCFVESAILFASALDKLCDKIVVVSAPQALRIARTIQRDYKGEQTAENIAKVKQRIAAQTEEESAIEHALRAQCQTPEIVTIVNDGAVSVEQLTDRLLVLLDEEVSDKG